MKRFWGLGAIACDRMVICLEELRKKLREQGNDNSASAGDVALRAADKALSEVVALQVSFRDSQRENSKKFENVVCALKQQASYHDVLVNILERAGVLGESDPVEDAKRKATPRKRISRQIK